MNPRVLPALAVALGALSASAGTASALTFTCETVARQDLIDPVGAQFTRKFEEPAVNGSGDVIFKGRTKDGLRTLNLYPAGGSSERLAFDGAPAPGGSTFTKFASPSINDDGDLAFFGDLDSGQGIFIRESGGSLTDAVRTGDTSPAGGTFETFEKGSRISDDADVAFLAGVAGGPRGIFLYDTSAATVSTVALVDGVTLEGRELCEFLNVDLGDGERAVFQALTKIDCADTLEADLAGVFRDTGLGIGTVALEGDPTPIGGTTYSAFFDVHVNAGNRVAFRAKPSTGGMAIFLFDPAGPSTTTVVLRGDAAPGTGSGTIRTIPQFELANTNQVAFRGKVIHGTTAKHGIFLFDTADQAVVLDSSDVPNDDWSGPASYRKIFEDIGVSRSATQVVYTAKVRDNLSFPSGTGVFRCEGT